MSRHTYSDAPYETVFAAPCRGSCDRVVSQTFRVAATTVAGSHSRRLRCRECGTTVYTTPAESPGGESA
jgi:hypothetical protein